MSAFSGIGLLEAQPQKECYLTIIDIGQRGCYTKVKWIILDEHLRRAVKLMLVSALERESQACRHREGVILLRIQRYYLGGL